MTLRSRTSELELLVINRQRARKIATAPLRKFAGQLVETLNENSDEFSIALVSDRKMREYNRSFRGINRTTDVLSFQCEDSGVNPAEEKYLGDILVSVETAARQARQGGRTFGQEIRILILHGYLHLLGYDHETDRGEMKRLERRMTRELIHEW
jgi:probable rRNA maturation factor